MQRERGMTLFATFLAVLLALVLFRLIGAVLLLALIAYTIGLATPSKIKATHQEPIVDIRK
jgi:hypothetical protein